MVFRRFLAILLLLMMLPAPAAEADGGPEELMAGYMAENGLNEDNFAMGWYDLESGESWYFGADEYRCAGSMYKLPLCMAVTDRLLDGTLSPDEPAGGYTVARAVELSIVYSDNDAAQALRYKLSADSREYRNILASYSGISPDELPEEYYTENHISPRFMINTLKYLYEHADRYGTVLEYMERAHEERYFKLYEGEYVIAHKYGYFEGALSDCAVVYAPRPFLLVAFLKNVPYAEQHLGEICRMMTEHALTEPEPAAELPEKELPGGEGRPAGFEPAGKLTAAETAPGVLPLLCAALGALMAVRKKRLAALLCAFAAAAALLALIIMPGPGEEASAAPDTVQTPPALPPEPENTPASPAEPERENAPAPSAEPERESWTLSFAGDCTIGTLHEWQGRADRSNMLHVMGGDYSYPFSGVAECLAGDDFTMVNLEGALTERSAAAGKEFRFRGPPEAAEALALGGIDAVSLANNHAADYLAEGLDDTRAALDAHGILWADGSAPLVAELDGGLKIGVAAFNCVETDLAVGDVDGYMERILPLYDACRDSGCGITAAFIHWGWEYRPEPEPWMEELASRLAEAGFDLVIGSHPHILQRLEIVDGTPVFYSLGNFCYGGHSAPEDTDTVIVRQEVVRSGAGFALGETQLIPCSVSGAAGYNDFRPVPYPPDSEGHARVLEKLAPAA